MNILMLGWELPPHNSGGLGVACFHMAKQLAHSGAAIDFVVPYKADHRIEFMEIHHAIDASPEELLLPGAYDSQCYRCEDSSLCEHTTPSDLRAQQYRYTEHVKRMVMSKRPDVIHAHDWLTFEAAVAAKQLCRAPLVAHVHATEFDRSGEHHGNPLVHEIEQTGLMMADKIIAVSKVTRDVIVEQYGVPANKIEIVHNSIDTTELPSVDSDNTYVYLEQMKHYGYKVIVTVGRLTVQKGLYYFLEAAQKAIRLHDKLLFVVAGSGELRDELLARSAELGIAEHIIFTGFVRGKAWRDAYAVADMFVMPSVSEPFGLVALEAAGYDNAVLISKQSGAAEVLRNILTFDFWDTGRLADQIVAVAQHEPLQRTMRELISEEYAAMSWEKAANKFQAIYSGLQHEHHTRSLAEIETAGALS